MRSWTQRSGKKRCSFDRMGKNGFFFSYLHEFGITLKLPYACLYWEACEVIVAIVRNTWEKGSLK